MDVGAADMLRATFVLRLEGLSEAIASSSLRLPRFFSTAINRSEKKSAYILASHCEGKKKDNRNDSKEVTGRIQASFTVQGFFRSSRHIMERSLGKRTDICGGFGVFIYLLCHHPLLRFVVLLGDRSTLLRRAGTFLKGLLEHYVGISRDYARPTFVPFLRVLFARSIGFPTVSILSKSNLEYRVRLNSKLHMEYNCIK